MVFSVPVCKISFTAEAQRRPKPVPTKGTRDYSLFKHEDHRKDLQCSSCHMIRSPLEPDRISAATKPSTNSSYPYHDSCFRCHRQQVYRGDRPVICTVCHTRVSPRTTAQDVYEQFPSPKYSKTFQSEFPGYFPHGIHQGVMTFRRMKATPDHRFVLASFRVTGSDPKASMDVCSTCHLTDERVSVSLPQKGIAAEENFKTIETDTFKTVPGYGDADAHAPCFRCHWESQKPTKGECNGCHAMRSDYEARRLPVIQPPSLSPNAEKWFKEWPGEIPKRFSLKFRHNTHTRAVDGKSEINNHDLGCTTCHANITQMTTLNISKADVQISSCAPCHVTTSAIPVSSTTRVTIFDEMTLRVDASKNYACIACHTKSIGREQPPCSHYVVLGEPCPKSAVSEKH